MWFAAIFGAVSENIHIQLYMCVVHVNMSGYLFFDNDRNVICLRATWATQFAAIICINNKIMGIQLHYV
jgi:hypothetical protein